MSINLDRVLFDRADVAGSPQTGAHLLGDSSALITSTTVASDVGLDVYLLNSLINVNVTDGTNSLDIDASGFITANINGEVDIRDLTHVSDSVKIGDGTDFLAIETDGSINVNASIAAPNGATASASTAVTNVATAIPASPLANRSKMLIQNRSNKSIFIGDSGVTTTTGAEVTKGGNIEIEVGPSQLIYAIGIDAGPHPVVTFERAK
jgi:hypothetical protein